MLRSILIIATAASVAASQTPYDAPRQTTLSSAAVDIPLIKDGDFYFVDVAINGKPLRLTIETGANFFALSPRAAQIAGLPIDTMALMGGPAPVGRVATLTMGGATFSGLAARITTMFEPLGFDGIIGLTVLHDVLATLDLAGKRLRLEKGELPNPNGRDVLPIAGLDRGGRIDIPIDVGGHRTGAVLDTRSFLWLILPDSVERQVSLSGAPRSIGTAMGPTLGQFQMRTARLDDDVRVGDATIQRPPIVFRDRPGAVLGVPMLEQFVITIDQVKRRVRMTHAPGPLTVPTLAYESDAGPTRRVEGTPGPSPLGFNLVGTPGGSLSVLNLAPGSNAEKAGLRNGDQVVEFDGTPVASMSPTIFRAAAARGTPVKVVVMRNGQRLELLIQPASELTRIE